MGNSKVVTIAAVNMWFKVPDMVILSDICLYNSKNFEFKTDSISETGSSLYVMNTVNTEDFHYSINIKPTEQVVAPCLGLIPKYLHDEKRMIDILNAMIRYVDSNMPIRDEWIAELSSLISNHHK